jgi:hypothetical protein
MPAVVFVPTTLSAAVRILATMAGTRRFVVVPASSDRHPRFIIRPISEEKGMQRGACRIKGTFLVFLPFREAWRFNDPVVDLDEGRLVLRSSPRIMTRIEEYYPPA